MKVILEVQMSIWMSICHQNQIITSKHSTHTTILYHPPSIIHIVTHKTTQTTTLYTTTPPSFTLPASPFDFGTFKLFSLLLSKWCRYGYGLGFPTGYLCGSIQKLDVEKKTISSTWEDKSCRATEPQFVPRPGSTGEEDGVVVFACLGTDMNQPKTEFIVLEPLHLTELGRFSVPYTTPIGFHGVWIWI